MTPRSTTRCSRPTRCRQSTTTTRRTTRTRRRRSWQDVPENMRSVTLQFTSDDATNQQIAGLMAQQLNSVGFEVKQRGLPETEVFNFTEAPENRRPDMIVLPQNPDDASPSSFPQLQWLSTGAFFPPIDEEADKVFQRAVQSGDRRPGARALRSGRRHVPAAPRVRADRQHEGRDRHARRHHQRRRGAAGPVDRGPRGR